MSPDRISQATVLAGMLLIAVVFGGGAAIHSASTTKPTQTVTVSGVNGSGMRVDRDHFRCRVWGRLKVCASDDVRWRVES